MCYKPSTSDVIILEQRYIHNQILVATCMQWDKAPEKHYLKTVQHMNFVKYM